MTLSSRDGALAVTGELLSFDGEIFRVETEFGVLTLDQSDVVCAGPGCPDLTVYIAEIDIVADADFRASLLPSAISEFAQSRGFRLVQRIELGAARLFELFEPDTGQLVGVFRLVNSVSSATSDAVFAVTRESSPWSEGRSRVIGLDAVVVVSGDQTPSDSVPLTVLTAVLSAPSSTWEALGGGDLPLDLVLPDRESAVADKLGEWMRRDLSITDPDRLWARRESNAVSSNPLAFGFGSLSETGWGLGLAGECGAAAFPTTSAIQTGEYPMAVPVSIHRPSGRLPRLGREFVRYLSSEEASTPVLDGGLVPLVLFEIPFHTQGRRLTNAILYGLPEAGREVVVDFTQSLEGSLRLSLGFRFLDGSTSLDQTSATNIDRLVEAIAQGRFDGRKLTFVGFSDSVGEGAANLRLSERRAEAVLNAVSEKLTDTERDYVDLTARGFGEAVPVVCNDTSENRRINRRVEVWVSQR